MLPWSASSEAPIPCQRDFPHVWQWDAGPIEFAQGGDAAIVAPLDVEVAYASGILDTFAVPRATVRFLPVVGDPFVIRWASGFGGAWSEWSDAYVRTGPGDIDGDGFVQISDSNSWKWYFGNDYEECTP